MEEHIIAKITERFCLDKEHGCGLLIECFPTGLGKSHEACYMMLDVIHKDPEAKFIFICNQTKNLPMDILCDIAKEEFGMSKEQVQSTVFLLKSNLDSFADNYNDAMKECINDLFNEFKVPSNVLNDAVYYRNKYLSCRKSSDNDYVEHVKKRFEDVERTFRNHLHKILGSQDTPKNRMKCIDEDRKYSWIRDLYPVVDFDSFRIILMTDSKFLHTIDPIVSSPFTIWSETDLSVTKRKNEVKDVEGAEENDYQRAGSRLTDHFIIIDEFDTFKKEMQKVIIEEQKDEVDVVQAFRHLYRDLPQWKSLPFLMIQESSWWRKNKRNSIEARFNTLIEKSQKIHDKYHMEYRFKQYRVSKSGMPVDSQAGSFIFRDYEDFNTSEGICICTEPDICYNRIIVGAKQSNTNLFKDLRSFIDSFSRLVRDLAFNYMYCQNEKEGGVGPVEGVTNDHSSFLNCVDSIIDVFDIKDNLHRLIKTKVIHNRLKTGYEKSLSLDDPTVFSRGFSYICMRDSVDRQLQTHLHYTEYDTTPEAILRHMAERTKIIALSATAELSSPICNFNLDYLRDGGVYFHEFDEVEDASVRKLLEDRNRGFVDGMCNLKCEVLSPVISYCSSSWESIFDEDTADDIFHKVGIANDQLYSGIRYVRSAQAFESFLIHDDIQSMIGFFSASVKDFDGDFSTEIVSFILQRLAIKHNICIGIRLGTTSDITLLNGGAGGPSAFFIQISGGNYDTVRDEVLDRLSGKYEGCNGVGQKVFVLTAYQTLGAGQNLQYPIPSDIREECNYIRSELHDHDMIDPRKDFDAIYLDDPTNIGPMVRYNDKESLDNYLLFAEYLDATGNITLEEKRRNIRDAFKVYCSSDHKNQPRHFKNCDAYLLAKAQVIYQAIGRMTRTGWKRKNSYIFIDNTIVKNGTFALPKEYYGSYLGYEFDTIYEKVHEISINEQEGADRLVVDHSIRRSHQIVSYLDNLRKRVYSGDSGAIDMWKRIRDFVLRNPTCPEKMEGLGDVERIILSYGYISPPEKTGRYWFALKDDFNPYGTDGLEISFKGETSKSSRKDIERKWYVVTPESAHLSMMASIGYVRVHLEKEGIPLVFTPNDRIMSPPLFRNIYMGALGEIVGKTMIEELTDHRIELSEMKSQLYEKFDYSFGDDFFFDFKDWSQTNYSDEQKTERLLQRIADKLKECNGKRVYIINIVVDGSQRYEPFHVRVCPDGREIVTVPYLYIVSDGKVIPNYEFVSKLEGDIGYE